MEIREPRWRRALVTGASAGIGAAISDQLAGDGTHLILVARDRERLREQAARLRREHDVEVDIAAADLSNPDDIVEVTRKIGDQWTLDLLVNNAGIGSVGLFHQQSMAAETAQIELNVLALVHLTHAAIPQMVAAGHGTIMNMSSLSARLPSPRNAVYGATKAFVTSFSESLHTELRDTGVTVTAVMPGAVRTEFQQRVGEHAFDHVPERAWMDADTVAASALGAAARGDVLHLPGRKYQAMAGAAQLMPRALLRTLARRTAPGQTSTRPGGTGN
ncbi:SDR family NAD(P)-dependent oxidoreductase [Nocardia cyriacigeorgica]|uniref:SDR family NAD(P)-dependent oxidoreductase n=1 Tax=Nocardia cyriacigeorgica TaxID=135487 RepID=UPI0024566C00|nr:SDR family oxidoreductase [Nocardia cyriacigeorgica]